MDRKSAGTSTPGRWPDKAGRITQPLVFKTGAFQTSPHPHKTLPLGRHLLFTHYSK
jgi:hypothetical protein